MVISVAGLAVARKTLPASSDEAAAPPAPKSGCSQALSIAPPEAKGRPGAHRLAQGLADVQAQIDYRNVRVSLLHEDLPDRLARRLLSEAENLHGVLPLLSRDETRRPGPLTMMDATMP